MSIIYSISILALFTLIIIMPKQKEKINILLTMLITLIIIFAYNAFVCHILNMLNIPITLLNLAIINFMICLIPILEIIKQKQLQQFYINKKDILISIIITLVTIIAIGINFKVLTKIHYVSMDSKQHYKAAREFYENETLADKYSSEYTTPRALMPMGYVNVGLLFKVFRPLIGLISLYKIYIIFEAIIYFCVGLMFYFLVKKHIKTTNQYIVASIFLIVYMLGYPLNAIISGFHYLIIGILYFIAIWYAMSDIIAKDKMKASYNIILLTLLNTGLIFSYALFCPPVYLAEFVYLIYHHRKKHNIRQIMIYITFALIVTGLMGCYTILYKNIQEIGSTGIELEGWIYKNDWSNFILFLPFSIYYIVRVIKGKEEEDLFGERILLFFVVFALMIAIGRKMGICSSYYFYKNSYILWLLILYTSILGMLKLLEKTDFKYAVNGFSTIYPILLIIVMCFIKTYPETEEKKSENMSKAMEIFSFNSTIMQSNAAFLSKGEIELLEKLDVELNGSWNNTNKILMLGAPSQEMWIQALTGYYKEAYEEMEKHIEEWNNADYEYLIVFNKRYMYKTYKDKLELNKAEEIYQNTDGKIYHIRRGK